MPSISVLSFVGFVSSQIHDVACEAGVPVAAWRAVVHSCLILQLEIIGPRNIYVV
jgi:hypothetical protein